MSLKSPDSELRLIKNLARGNILAFNTLFEIYSNHLYHFAYGYLKSEAEAEEIVQEVFMIIWEKRKALKSNLSFKAYIFKIAFNIIMKHFRTKRYIFKYLAEEIDNDIDFHTQEKVEFDSLFQYIQKIVAELPDRHREIFIKSRIEELSIKEIARELNISTKTVENQITNSLKYIREKLKIEN